MLYMGHVQILVVTRCDLRGNLYTYYKGVASSFEVVRLGSGRGYTISIITARIITVQYYLVS